METGSAASLWSNPLALALIAIAIAACLYGMVSMNRAWSIAASHPPFVALGAKRWVMGYAGVPYMPQASRVHVKRHFLSVLIMAACLIALIVLIWTGTAR